jgi:hypothetical protein
MEELKSVCNSPWCKATFIFSEQDMETDEKGNKIPPITCNKCKSFNNDLSAGVEWKDKEYEGSRFDSTPHEIKYRVTNFRI